MNSIIVGILAFLIAFGATYWLLSAKQDRTLAALCDHRGLESGQTVEFKRLGSDRVGVCP